MEPEEKLSDYDTILTQFGEEAAEFFVGKQQTWFAGLWYPPDLHISKTVKVEKTQPRTKVDLDQTWQM